VILACWFLDFWNGGKSSPTGRLRTEGDKYDNESAGLIESGPLGRAGFRQSQRFAVIFLRAEPALPFEYDMEL